MTQASNAFGSAAGQAQPFSDRIKKSVSRGEEYAREICNRVQDFNDPDLLAALRESFQFFLKGAISLHRKRKDPKFWEGALEQRQQNFLAQVVQLHAVIHISRFVHEKHPEIDWEELAHNIPSEVRPERAITSRVARQFATIFSQVSSADPVLAGALPLVLSDLEDMSACIKALEPAPRVLPEPVWQPQISVAVREEQKSPPQRQETLPPIPCPVV